MVSSKLTKEQREAIVLIRSMCVQIKDQCNQVVNGGTDANLVITTVDLLAGQIADLTKSF